MTRDELLRRYAAGERDFRGANLTGANLKEADLEGVNLSWADLAGTNFGGANLNRSVFKGADLRRSNLKGADLGGAILTGANLAGAILSGACLGRAVLNWAVLRVADLSGANLAGADLRGADLEGTKLPSAPAVPNLDSQILAAVSPADAGLHMDKWHTCETTHCLAGWAIHLAGEEGYKLELAVGSAMAGTLIYHASTGAVPDFYAKDEKALADLKSRATGRRRPAHENVTHLFDYALPSGVGDPHNGREGPR